MSNNTETPRTVLDMLESHAEGYFETVKDSWEHSGKIGGKDMDIRKRFMGYHLASVRTFMQIVMDPTRAFTFVLGAVARDLINAMTEDEKAELATITLEELENAKREL